MIIRTLIDAHLRIFDQYTWQRSIFWQSTRQCNNFPNKIRVFSYTLDLTFISCLRFSAVPYSNFCSIFVRSCDKYCVIVRVHALLNSILGHCSLYWNAACVWVAGWMRLIADTGKGRTVANWPPDKLIYLFFCGQVERVSDCMGVRCMQACLRAPT